MVTSGNLPISSAEIPSTTDAASRLILTADSCAARTPRTRTSSTSDSEPSLCAKDNPLKPAIDATAVAMSFFLKFIFSYMKLSFYYRQDYFPVGIARSTPRMGDVEKLAFRKRQISVKHSNNFF